MLTDFQNSFTGRLSGKFAINWYLNIPPHLKRVATLPCEISMLKNDRAPEETEAHSHVRFSHSKISCKNICLVKYLLVKSVIRRRSRWPYKNPIIDYTQLLQQR